MVKIITGPVVGMVTHDTIRLLLEVDRDCTLTAVCNEAQNHDGSHITAHGLAFRARRPRAVTITGLRSATEYMVEFVVDDSRQTDSGSGLDDDGRPIELHDSEDIEIENGEERVARVATFGRKGEEHNDPQIVAAVTANSSGNHHHHGGGDAVASKSMSGSLWAHRVAIVSGNDQAKSERTMWDMLADRVQQSKLKKLDMVIHTSGQVRGEEAFRAAKELVGEGEQLTAEQEDKIAELYRDLYRKNWNSEPMRNLLSTVSNLMLIGQKDICDNWGSEDSHRSPDSVDFKIATIARRIYWEYQRQLWQDMPTSDEELQEQWGKSHEGYHCIVDTLGLLFVDTVASSTFVRVLSESKGILSQDQMDSSIKAKLSTDDGVFNTVDALLCVTASPIAFVSSDSDVDKAIAPVGRESTLALGGDHADDRAALLEAIAQWQSAGSKRSAMLVSGGMLCGCHSVVSTDGGSILKQLVVSPVCHETPQDPNIANIEGKEHQLGGNISVVHSDLCTVENMGIVDVYLSADGKKRTTISPFIIKRSSKVESGATGGWEIQGSADSPACCTVS